MPACPIRYALSDDEKREYRRWMRRITALYGALALAGIVLVASHKANSGPATTTDIATTAVQSVVTAD